jgi:predicted nucleotidyltransferase
LKNQFIKQLSPIRIYLFDSFADGTNTDDSDFDFYIVVDDKITDLVGAAASAYKAIRLTKQRPVNIIVGTESQFNKQKEIISLEKEVAEKGILLYEAEDGTVKQNC